MTSRKGDQNLTNERPSARDALTFWLHDINGYPSFADQVVFGNPVVEGNEDIKSSVLCFGQQISIESPGPAEEDDVGALVSNEVLDQRNGKILVKQDAH
jgi:hypothetical protein